MLTAEDVTDAVGTAPQPVAPYPPRPARLELLCGGHAHRQVAAALVVTPCSVDRWQTLRTSRPRHRSGKD